jgi:hypothetical protein
MPVAVGLALATTPGMLTHRGGEPASMLGSGCYHDGGNYLSVLTNGYSYDPNEQSTVAFLPAYPLAASVVERLAGLAPRVALLVTSNAAFAAALVLLSAYLRSRELGDPPGTRAATLLAAGFCPVGFYFRMAYSESLFFAAVVLLMLGLARRWPAWALAFIAGAATGIRTVGVVAPVTVTLHILTDPARGPWRKRLLTAALLAPLSCWGLLAYMGYQYAEFGDPFAFALTHRHWFIYTPETPSWAARWERLATAEPIWNVYVPSSQRYWDKVDTHGNPLLGLAFWDPIVFVLAVIAVGFGWLRGWLTRTEVVLAAGLLLIPYVSRADEMSMMSQSRFVSVVAPVYVVLGRGLGRLHPAVGWAVFGVFASLLTLWTALFAAAWPLI